MGQDMELKKFRQEREEALKKNWLVVVGLHWLKEGVQTVGSSKTAHVLLPSSVPAEIGTMELKKQAVEFKVNAEKGVRVDGVTAQRNKSYALNSDKSGAPTLVEVGTVQFFVIERPNGIGVRVKDSQSQTLKEFKGLHWWEENSKLKISGEWKKIMPPQTLIVPDVLGNMNEEKIEGKVAFKIEGKNFELFPTRSGDELFFIFKDQTTGKDSYGTGRFLQAKVSKNESVVLDFNRAYNPPCAHIAYATCPMAPAENKIDFPITAGEKKPSQKH